MQIQTREMVKALKFGLTGLSMKGIGLMIRPMAMED